MYHSRVKTSVGCRSGLSYYNEINQWKIDEKNYGNVGYIRY